MSSSVVEKYGFASTSAPEAVPIQMAASDAQRETLNAMNIGVAFEKMKVAVRAGDAGGSELARVGDVGM